MMTTRVGAGRPEDTAAAIASHEQMKRLEQTSKGGWASVPGVTVNYTSSQNAPAKKKKK